MRTQIKILGISDRERINVHFCQFSQKETFFLHFKKTIFFISLCSFEGVQHF